MRNGSLNYLTNGGGALLFREALGYFTKCCAVIPPNAELGYSAKCCARKSTAMT